MVMYALQMAMAMNDMSMPPLMIIIITPQAKMPVTIIVRKRSNIFRRVRNAGFRMEKEHITITRMANTMNSPDRTNLRSFF